MRRFREIETAPCPSMQNGVYCFSGTPIASCTKTVISPNKEMKMNQTERTLEKLQRVVKAGQERLEKHGELNLGYVERFVIPALKDVLRDRCGEIEEVISSRNLKTDKKILSFTIRVSMLSFPCFNKKQRTDRMPRRMNRMQRRTNKNLQKTSRMRH